MAVVAAGLIAHAAPAQRAPRVTFGGDSLARLTVNLSPPSRNLLNTYLTGPDSMVPRVVGGLMNDPGAADFMLAILAREPLPQVRQSVISGISFRIHLARHPGTLAALQDRVRKDTTVGVVRGAVAMLNTIAVLQAGSHAILSERIASDIATDTAMMRLLLDEEEKVTLAERSIIGPGFARTPPPPFAAVPAARPIRVLAFGDYGTAHLGGSSHQAALAAVMRSYHAKHPFTFGLTAGDNFYGTAFPSPDDPKWKTSWSGLYDRLKIPFYISLGNHDWAEPAGPLSEYIYGRTSSSWKLPSYYYTYTAGAAQFFAINTNALTSRQLSWLRQELGKSTAKWKIVYGHFPVYEQTNYTVEPQQRLLLPIFKEFGVDVYICGHHHTMQHWQLDGIDYVVSGAAGAVNYSLGDTTKAAPGRKFMASMPGFADLAVTSGSMTLRFVGMGERVLYEYTRKK